MGKKELFWEIKSNTAIPKFILLENVDRLLKSPQAERRDFAVMLSTINELGYEAE